MFINMYMYYHRHLETVLTGATSQNKIRILFGARQVGKTELFRHLLGQPKARFFNLQDASDRRRFEAEPEAFGRAVRALPAKTSIVVIDEIQKVPALLDEIQSLYDSSRKRWQFYLTGSSARRLRSSSANLLPGRAHIYHMHRVCSWEVEGGQSATSVLRPSSKRTSNRRSSKQPSMFPRRSLSRLLTLGALPGIWTESRATAQATLEAYVDLYLEDEIRREALVRDLGPFNIFLKFAAMESGRQINIAGMSQESGVPASTLKNYYQVLVDTFVGHWMPAYSRRGRKRLLTSPRFYFFDTGVRNVAAGMSLDGNVNGILGGPLLEHHVGLELIARASYLGRTYGVSFWRTHYGVEVDFIWQSPSEDIPIEVKWTDRPRPADARHVETFLDEFPERAKRGFVVCRCAHREQLTKRVTAIPWNEL